MKQIAWLAILLLSPWSLYAAPAPDPPSTTGVWRIDGEVMGAPVRMTCTLTEANHKLSGVCSGAADGFLPHKIAGKVKAQKLELYFQTLIGGNAITLIVNGTLNDDSSQMNGNLDVEPMAVGGAFVAVRMPPSDAPAPPAAGTWNITGDVQGIAVKMTCVLIEERHKLTGTCTGAGGGTTPRALTGEASVNGIDWHFDSEYEGNPITVSMSAALVADGTKMSGTITVAPMDAAGTFVALKPEGTGKL